MQEMKTGHRHRWVRSLWCVASHATLLLIATIATGQSLCPPEATKWTPQEKEAWKNIRKGEVADMEKAGSPQHHLDPNSAEGWNDASDRAISPGFLETIFNTKECSDAIPFHGIQIRGAYFKDPIQLSNVHIEHPLKFEECRFEKEVDLSYISTSSAVTIRGCKFLEKFDIGGALIKGSLRIESYGDNKPGVSSIRTEFDKEFILQDARTNGYIYLKDVVFTGDVSMGRLQTDTFLQMDGIQPKGTMDLSGMKADYLIIKDGNFADTVKMNSLKIGGDLVIYGVKDPVVFTNEINLEDSKIDGNLEIEFSSVESIIDLSGSQIGRKLLISSDLDWHEGSGLILANAHIGTLKCPMPEELVKLNKVSFSGCTYSRLYWVDKQDPSKDIDISTPWNEKKMDLTKLFEKYDEVSASKSAVKRSYSAQPYEQLAGVLRKEGYTDLANTVLFDEKEAERSSSHGLQWVLLTMQLCLIGYGYKYSIVFISTFIIIIVGFLMIRYVERRKESKSWCIIYSIDMLLPVLQLEKSNYDITLESLAKYWFYFQKTAGFILASFVIAGITGITK